MKRLTGFAIVTSMWEKLLFRFIAALVAVALLATTAQAVTIEYVPVGDPGNVDDTHGEGYGGVTDPYLIGKYEVTNAQYCQFLNAVADADPNDLYNTNMGRGGNDIGGISRTGDPGTYEYTVRENRGNRPVNWVSWYDTLRFANWLHNGQPTGPQSTGTTEDGAYVMSLGSSVIRKAGAQVFLPSEDEWYKAAYYKSGGANAGYWDYPTQSDTAPTAELPAGTDMVNGSANYRSGGYLDTMYYTTEVGAYDAKPSDSAYGTFDQGGNLLEWNETPFGLFPYRGLRGGDFGGPVDNLHASFRYSEDPAYEDFNIGFRVASIPEPGSITLLACGLVAGLIWWRRRR
jgi:sulfatase modifying factor 1